MTIKNEHKLQNTPKEPYWRWIFLGIAVALTAVWLFLTPEGLLGKAEAVGYAVCHQIDVRSFHLGDRPMPLCARCSGMFLGALLGIFYQALQGRKGKMPPWPVLILFGLFALSWAFDGANSFLMLVPQFPSLYQTQNWTRLLTGTGMGLAVAAILWPTFVQTMFRRWEKASSLGNWKQIGGSLLAAGLLDVLVMVENPVILFPLALLSAGGVLLLLIMVYSVALVMIFKKENTYQSFRQLFMPLTGGYIVALMQIGVINLLRYLVTGSWGGFNLEPFSAIISVQQHIQRILQLWIF
ncbi:MAG: DUF2085 domain-containing protein [Brevefilum sp.]